MKTADNPVYPLCTSRVTPCAYVFQVRQLLLTLSAAPRPPLPQHGAGGAEGAEGNVPCVATASLLAAGLQFPTALHTLQALLRTSLAAVVQHAAALWQLGAPHFALCSLERPVLQLPLAPASPAALLPRAVPAALRLRPLPATFEQLFHASLKRHCSVCGIAPASRALCLACGACVCGHDTLRSHCVCAGLHAQSCGAGTSLYLLTNSSSVVLVRNGRLLMLPTPYRDSHGEVDLGLQRGKPLSLDEHEYLSLTRRWLAMSFDDTAKGDEADQMF